MRAMRRGTPLQGERREVGAEGGIVLEGVAHVIEGLGNPLSL